MRRDVGRHADRDAGRAVYQQVGEAGREHDRLLTLLVKVRLEIDCVLLDVRQHVVCQSGHAGLGVTICCRRVAVHRTEVAVAVDQRIVQRERLRHTHHCVIDRCVAVRMIAAEHVTDGRCRLAVGLVRGQTVLVHSVQDAAVYRLEAVAHIGQRAGDDNRHGIGDERVFQLVLDVQRNQGFALIVVVLIHKAVLLAVKGS